MQYYDRSFVVADIDNESLLFLKDALKNYDNFDYGGAGSERKSKIRSSKICWIKDTEIINRVFEYVCVINEHYGWNWAIDGFDALQYTKYESGDYYNYHTDEGGWNKMNFKSTMRKLSITLLLNDDFEGGEFEIERPYRYENDMSITKSFEKIDLCAGSFIVFHSDMTHRVCPVIKGTRESLVGWVNGPPFV